MATCINKNKYQFWGKIVLQLVLFSIFVLTFAVILRPQGNDLYFIIPFEVFFLLLNILCLIQLTYLPIGVIINSEKKVIEVKYFFLSTIQISLHNISSYASTKIYTKSEMYDGLLLRLTNDKIILLSNYNLKSYQPVYDFLKINDVRCLEDEKFQFSHYYYKAIKD